MCVQVRKGRFVVLTEGHMGADSAFCMGGEQLWLGKVEHLGPNSIQLLMYKPQRNAAGEAPVLEQRRYVDWQCQACQCVLAKDEPIPGRSDV